MSGTVRQTAFKGQFDQHFSVADIKTTGEKSSGKCLTHLILQTVLLRQQNQAVSITRVRDAADMPVAEVDIHRAPSLRHLRMIAIGRRE